MIKPRPKSLAEVVSRTLGGAVFNMELADFLDEFYQAPSSDFLRERPGRMEGKLHRGHHKDVYVAAVAEHLGRQYGIEIGDWAFAADLVLERPEFAYQTPIGKAYLLRDSPPAFKCRNLFGTPNVLSRV